MIEQDPKGRMYHFHTTPAMPPYLLAFAVGHWDMVSGFTVGGAPVDVYTPIGQAQRGQFALTIAADSIDFFESYLGVPYPLPRLQLASIPDFAPGAMENWGFVTFRDVALLGAPGDTAQASLARIAEVVVHENCHMWAGDLVSPKSWADLWLNEGFASMLPLLCLTQIAPAYSSWLDFRRFDVQEAMTFDFSRYTHPIRLPDESATPQFDSVTYSKGATVLYMLWGLMGDAEFRGSLKQYFTEYQFGSASTDDLVASFDGSSRANVTSFMRVWTERAGFPTITVSRTNDGFLLRQGRLTVDGTEIEGVWPLPIGISDGSRVLMNERTLRVPGTGLVTFNDGREAMAMIEYDEDLLPEVLGNFRALSAGARWMLLEDLRLLVLSRRTSPSRLWEAIERVWNETDVDVIEAALGAADFMFSLWPERLGVPLSDIFRRFVNLTRAPSETLIVTRLRAALATFLGVRVGDASTVELLEAIRLDEAPEDLLSVLMRLRAQWDFELVKHWFETAETPQRRNAAQVGMGATENDVDKAFEMLIGGVKSHEVATLLSSLSRNSRAKGMIPGWVIEKSSWLKTTFGNEMSAIIGIALGSVDEEGELYELSRFLEAEWPRLDQTIGRGKELAKARIDLACVKW
jgi:hypothetical protein